MEAQKERAVELEKQQVTPLLASLVLKYLIY
jgi:hypothetical protein